MLSRMLPACVMLLTVAFNTIGGGVTLRRLTVAQILGQGGSLENRFVEVTGQIHCDYEFVYVSDDSTCAPTQRVCKLALRTRDNCRVVGRRYTGSVCDSVLWDEFVKNFHQAPQKHWVITNVKIRGKLATREGRAFDAHQVPGFGNLGVYPAEIAAMEIDFDKAQAAPQP